MPKTDILKTASELSPKKTNPRTPSHPGTKEREPGYPQREGGLVQEKVYEGGMYPKKSG